MTEERKAYALGTAIPIPFEPDTPEKKAFFDNFDRYLTEEGKIYVLDTLKVLGPKIVAQTAFGHEYVDRCQEVKDVLASKLDPAKNALGSAIKAGYVFGVFPEISAFRDNHPSVEGVTLSFSVYMIGEDAKMPPEKVWRKSVASPLLGCTVESVKSVVYSVDERSKGKGIWLKDVLSSSSSEKLTDEKKTVLMKHYGLKSNEGEEWEKFDPAKYDPFSEPPIAGASSFKEDFLWCFDSEFKHPTMNFNEMEGLPSTCKAVRICGNTDLLKYKEMGEARYLEERVFRPSGLEKRKNRGGVGEKKCEKQEEESAGETTTLLELLEKSVTPTELEANFKQKNGESAIYKKKDATTRSISDFFKKNQASSSSKTKEEEEILYEMYPGELGFLKEKARYFSLETSPPDGETCTWRPSLSKCSHLSEKSCDTVLVNLDFLREQHPKTLFALFGPRKGGVVTKDMIGNIERGLKVFRVFIRWSFKKDHSRAHCKRVPQVPKEILTKEELIQKKKEYGQLRKNPRTFICTAEPEPSEDLLARKSKIRYAKLGLVAFETGGNVKCDKNQMIKRINELRAKHSIARSKNDIFSEDKIRISPEKDVDVENDGNMQSEEPPKEVEKEDDDDMSDFQQPTASKRPRQQKKAAATATTTMTKKRAPRKKRPTVVGPPRGENAISSFLVTRLPSQTIKDVSDSLTTTTTTPVKREEIEEEEEDEFMR
jgi:hypothetical protein